MNTNCATSSRKVMVRIQRRTTGETLSGGLLAGGGRRTALQAAAIATKLPAKKRSSGRTTSSGCQIFVGHAAGGCGLLGRWLAASRLIEQPLYPSEQMSRFTGALG